MIGKIKKCNDFAQDSMHYTTLVIEQIKITAEELYYVEMCIDSRFFGARYIFFTSYRYSMYLLQ